MPDIVAVADNLNIDVSFISIEDCIMVRSVCESE